MIKSTISKTLLSIVHRTTEELNSKSITASYKDYLVASILEDDATMAFQLLTHFMDSWQVERLPRRIKAAIENTPLHESLSPDSYYDRLCTTLYDTIETPSLSTVHILYSALCDSHTHSHKIITGYGINADDITTTINQLGERNPSPRHHIAKPHSSYGACLTAETELSKYGENLTLKALQGDIDIVVGRDGEIERMIHILSRRKKNNPILIGEAGVGKSAIVEGLALRIAQGLVPRSLAGKQIYSIDMARLIAGTKFRGEFEERMSELLDILTRERNTIIFIDEIHTIVGAGATQGSLDVANMLKPALARGTMQTIGATTPEEYRATIERDAALERRFQGVWVSPLSSEHTRNVIEHLTPYYEEYHGVRYTTEALDATIELAERYITTRHFPDKAIDIMDEAGARRAIAPRSEGDTYINITREDIEQVVHRITGIPVERLSDDERCRLQCLGKQLSTRIIGQQRAIESITRTIFRSRTGLSDAQRPWGVFLFVGPTGVGKTLMAKHLAELLYSHHRSLIRVDMSEYQERHTISRLIGSPPGYVGYGEGGELSEAVRRNPYSVVLLDEIEKAHHDIYNLLLQIFDEGRLTDSLGREIDFRHTIIILTSNLGSNPAHRHEPIGYGLPTKGNEQPDSDDSRYLRAVEAHFTPELMNRIDEVVLFDHISKEDMLRIVDIEIDTIVGRLLRHNIELDISPRVRLLLAEKGYDRRYGARAVKRIIATHLEVPIATMLVEGCDIVGRRIYATLRGNKIELQVRSRRAA